MKAIRVDAPCGPEAMRLVDVPEPAPREGEVLVKVEAAGVNFIDVYHRTGAYPLSFPLVLGGEGAGVVVSARPGVSEVAPGDRVAFGGASGTTPSSPRFPRRSSSAFPTASRRSRPRPSWCRV